VNTPAVPGKTLAEGKFERHVRIHELSGDPVAHRPVTGRVPFRAMAVILREPKKADAEAVGPILLERDESLGQTNERDNRWFLGKPRWTIHDDAVIAVSDDTPIAYAWVRDEGDYGSLEMWVAEGHRAARVGTRLMRWAIDKARKLPALRTITLVDDRVGRMLNTHGSVAARGGFRMDLRRDDTPAPEIPDGFVVRVATEKSPELVHLICRLDQEGFADVPGFSPTPMATFEKTVARDDFDLDLAWFVFTDDGKEAGFCICSYIPDRQVGAIEDLAVIDTFRGKGLARALVRLSIHALWERGAKEIVLETGNDNLAAHRLYESEGFEVTFRRQGWLLDFSKDRGSKLGVLDL
jgi:ribosomal protein S18 acetylase RimI-like enzyme